jgi:hypothetical protein
MGVHSERAAAKEFVYVSVRQEAQGDISLLPSKPYRPGSSARAFRPDRRRFVEAASGDATSVGEAIFAALDDCEPL